jgi:cytoskeletal protein CcmA (bactofilin family)
MPRRSFLSIVTSSVTPLGPPRDPRPLARLPRPIPERPTLVIGPGISARAPIPERPTLLIGPGISVRGIVSNTERLVVEGTLEVALLSVIELRIAEGGKLKGRLDVEDAEISGVLDGTLTAKGSLVVRGTGHIIGEARCQRLQVDDGGQLSGTVSSIGEATVPRRDRFPTQRTGRPTPILAEKRGVETSITNGRDLPLPGPVNPRQPADPAQGAA